MQDLLLPTSDTIKSVTVSERVGAPPPHHQCWSAWSQLDQIHVHFFFRFGRHNFDLFNIEIGGAGVFAKAPLMSLCSKSMTNFLALFFPPPVTETRLLLDMPHVCSRRCCSGRSPDHRWQVDIDVDLLQRAHARCNRSTRCMLRPTQKDQPKAPAQQLTHPPTNLHRRTRTHKPTPTGQGQPW